jgi:hypothetical protein
MKKKPINLDIRVVPKKYRPGTNIRATFFTAPKVSQFNFFSKNKGTTYSRKKR